MTTTMATKATAASQPSIVMQTSREPPTFRGLLFEYPETSLVTYDRVSALNRRDTEEKLRRVYLYFEKAERTSLENQKSALSTWNLEVFTSVTPKIDCVAGDLSADTK